MFMRKTQIDLLKKLAEVVPHALIMTDAANRIIFTNQLAAKHFDYTIDELSGISISALIPPQSGYNGEIGELVPLSGTRTPHEAPKLYGTRKDGARFPVELLLSSIAAGNQHLTIISVMNISARQGLEEKFRLAVESAPNGLLMVDERGLITLANHQLEQYFGYSRHELIGQPVEKLLPARYSKDHEALREGFMNNPHTLQMGAGRDLYAVGKDGSEFPVEIGLNPIRTETGIEVLAVIIDITQRKQAEKEHAEFEKQIQSTQRLESLAILAGGVAHDFNNLLTGILGNSDLALLETPPGSEAREYIEDIQKTAVRAAELCNQMLAYSGKAHFVVEALDLNHIIEETAHLLRNSVLKTAALRYSLAPDLPPLKGAGNQIRQVVLNLVTNAAEAFGAGKGKITITTGVTPCDRTILSRAVANDHLPEGDYIYLEVTDNGVGMESSMLETIFDPFFTTKFSGRGLGLAATLGIVRGHKGAIIVKSTKGKGSTFRVLFPCTQATISKTVDEHSNMGDLQQPAKVLVVDDDDSVRVVTQRCLERMGLHVITANDGKEGVEVFGRVKDELSLAIVDLTMPHLNGVEVVRLIHKAKPDLPVIFTSGYNEQELIGQVDDGNRPQFIQKPIRPQILIPMVKKLLAQN